MNVRCTILNHECMTDYRLQKGYVPITIIKGFKTAILMLYIITSKLDPFFSRPRISVRSFGLGPAYLFGNLYIVSIYYDR